MCGQAQPHGNPGSNPDEVSGILPSVYETQKPRFYISRLSPTTSHLTLQNKWPSTAINRAQIREQPDSIFMATESHSVKAKVASDGPREAPDTPEQSNVQSSSEAKDTETLFKEAFEESENMTSEERREKFPILSE